MPPHLPEERPVESAGFLYGALTDDIRFRSPTDLRDRYEAALEVEVEPRGRRSYWTNSPQDERELDRVMQRGVSATRSSKYHPTSLATGAKYRSFDLPMLQS